MKVSPSAGKPPDAGMLVNVPRLITAYYTDVPDPRSPHNESHSALQVIVVRLYKRPLMSGISSPLRRQFVSIENCSTQMVHCFLEWTLTRFLYRLLQVRLRCWRQTAWK